MNRRFDAWGHLRDLVAAHGVEAALVQEAIDPVQLGTQDPGRLPSGWSTHPAAGDSERWRVSVPLYRLTGTGERAETMRRWCSAVVTTGNRLIAPRVPEPLQPGLDGAFSCSHPGQFAVGDIALEDGQQLTLISLYGIWDRMGDSGDIFVEATLHRAISDLTMVFQERAAEYVLVGGDLNVYSYSDGTVWGDRGMTVLSRLAAYGLEICGPKRPAGEPRLDRCPCPDPECEHVHTFLYQSNPKNRPHQLDFFFATAALRERLAACWADPDPDWPTHSDHRPIFASFDL
jgi:hypothetical protein